MTNPIRQQLEHQLAEASPAERVQAIFDFYDQRGHSHYDEAVTQLQHALQCAALAKENGLSDQAVTSALLHDIGHLLLDEHNAQDGFLAEDMNHEEIGANLLQAWFPDEVTEPIRLHVAAKRYLCSTDDEYYDQLSDASKRSFQVQGGKLSAEELSELEQNAGLELAVKLRRYDDLGKAIDKDCPPLESYADAVLNSLR